MRSAAFLLLLFGSQALASPFLDAKECEHWVVFVHQIGVLRDNGVPQAQADKYTEDFIAADRASKPPLLIRDEQDAEFARSGPGSIYSHEELPTERIMENMRQYCMRSVALRDLLITPYPVY